MGAPVELVHNIGTVCRAIKISAARETSEGAERGKESSRGNIFFPLGRIITPKKLANILVSRY